MVQQYSTAPDFEAALAQSEHISRDTVIKGLRETVGDFLEYITGFEAGQGDIEILTSERHPPEPVGVVLTTDDIAVLTEAFDSFGVGQIADYEGEGDELTIAFHFD